MEVIVLDGDSDEGEHTSKDAIVSTSNDAEGYSRPAKRQRQEPSCDWVTDTVNTVDLCDVSHVSETVQEPSVTEAPVQPASAADDAESPTLSPQQVRKRPCIFLDCSLPCTLTCTAHLSLQQEVEDLVKQGKNVFFTGNAGTGNCACSKDLLPSCSFPGLTACSWWA